jgi:hypothetical protein
MLRRDRQRFEYHIEAHLLSESEAISNSAGEAVDPNCLALGRKP